MNVFWLVDKHNRFEKALDAFKFSQVDKNDSYSINQLDYLSLYNQVVAIDSSTGSWIVSDCAMKDLQSCLDTVIKDGSDSNSMEKLFKRNILRKNNEVYLPSTIYSNNGRNLPIRYLFIVETTERCNLECVYCFKSATPTGKDLSDSMATKIAEYIDAHDYPAVTVEFAGGEPTINLDAIETICDTLVKTSDKKLFFTVQTNATNVTDRFISLARKYDIGVSASIEGSERYLSINRPFASGKDSSKKILCGLDRLVESDLLTGVVAVHNAKVSPDPHDLVRMLKGRGITRVKYNNFVPVGRGKNNEEELRVTNISYLNYLTSFVLAGLNEKKVILENNTYHIAQRIINRIPNYRCSNSPCDAGYTFQSIRPNGDVYPCDRYTERKELSLGNIITILNDNVSNKHRVDSEKIAARNNEVLSLNRRNIGRIPHCSTCNIRSFCGAGCGMESFDIYGNYYSPSALCGFYKSYIPIVFDWILNNTAFQESYCGTLSKNELKLGGWDVS